MWRTPHYPFHAVKQGTSLFFDFLTDLDFGDEVGIVSYGTYAVKEWDHFDGEVSIDISSDPITADYATLDSIQRRHQAGHYDDYTGMGDGILKGRELLLGVDSDPNDEGFSRYGARPTMIVMTDGQANRCPSGWSLPGSFKWKDWTDYDGDGVANYTTTDKNKQYAFWEATKAIDRGATLHTLAVGADGDRGLDGSDRLRRRRHLHQRPRRQHGGGDGRPTARRVQADRVEGSAGEVGLRISGKLTLTLRRSFGTISPGQAFWSGLFIGAKIA